jgi:hypothetical protein
MSFSGNVTSMDRGKFSSSMIINEQAKMIEQLKKENEELKSALEFYGEVKDNRKYRVAFCPSRVLEEDLEDFNNNGVTIKISGKLAREVLTKYKGSK